MLKRYFETGFNISSNPLEFYQYNLALSPIWLYTPSTINKSLNYTSTKRRSTDTIREYHFICIKRWKYRQDRHKYPDKLREGKTYAWRKKRIASKTKRKKKNRTEKYKKKILHFTSVTVLQFLLIFSSCFLTEKARKKIELDNLKCGHLE
jgi:hypothetical protein